MRVVCKRIIDNSSIHWKNVATIWVYALHHLFCLKFYRSLTMTSSPNKSGRMNNKEFPVLVSTKLQKAFLPESPSRNLLSEGSSQSSVDTGTELIYRKIETLFIYLFVLITLWFLLTSLCDMIWYFIILKKGCTSELREVEVEISHSSAAHTYFLVFGC